MKRFESFRHYFSAEKKGSHMNVKARSLMIATVLSLPLTLEPAHAAPQAATVIGKGSQTTTHTETVAVSSLADKIQAIRREPVRASTSAITLSSDSACIPAPVGLIAWFSLDENEPQIPELNTGLMASRQNGPTTVAGKVSNGMQFDGRDDYVEVAGPTASIFNIAKQNISFDAWVRVRPNDPQTGVRVIIEKRQQNPIRGYSFYIYAGRPAIQLADMSGYTNYGATFTVPPDGEWHLIAVTVDRTAKNGGRFYLDGAQVGATFDPSNRVGDLSNAAPLRIGSVTLSATPGSVFAGSLDEIEVFTRDLTPEEVRALASAGAAGKCRLPAAIKIHLECDGKKADFDVTGVISAYQAIDWCETNCTGHKVTVSW